MKYGEREFIKFGSEILPMIIKMTDEKKKIWFKVKDFAYLGYSTWYLRKWVNKMSMLGVFKFRDKRLFKLMNRKVAKKIIDECNVRKEW